MNGMTTISCSQSGYSASIQFLPKPLYGGKKNQFQGSLYGPEKKVLNTFDGDWSNDMFLKTGSKKELLIENNDSNKRARKQLKKICDQVDNESRVVWQAVTAHLRNKQVEEATNAKFQIEEKQREIAKQRKIMNTVWQAQYFSEKNGHWIFKNPLSKRILSS